jgi:hypothetical protein
MGWRPRAVPGMAFGCVPSQRGWTRQRSDARPATPSEGVPGDSVPTTTTVGCVPWDAVRGRSRRWPVQARDALPAMAVGCGIRVRWRSGRSTHRAESYVGFSTQRPLVPAQRAAVQLPRARSRSAFQNTNDLAREAVNCNGLFGGGRYICL